MALNRKIQFKVTRVNVAQNNTSERAVLRHDNVSHLEGYQEYMLRGTEHLGRLV